SAGVWFVFPPLATKYTPRRSILQGEKSPPGSHGTRRAAGSVVLCRNQDSPNGRRDAETQSRKQVLSASLRLRGCILREHPGFLQSTTETRSRLSRCRHRGDLLCDAVSL